MRCCRINKYATRFVFVLLMTFSLSASAQSRVGFLGKRNSISIDALQLLMNDKINLGYRFCVSNRVAFEFGYNIFSGSGRYEVGEQVSHRTADEQFVNSSGKGRYDITGEGWDFQMTLNSPLPNMPMPIGFYWGFGFGYDRVTLNNHLTGVSISQNTNETINVITYNHRMLNIYLLYGKSTSLGSNFALDASLEIGIRYGGLESSDSTSNNNMPEFIAPRALPWNTYNTDLDTGVNTDYKSYFKIILLPHLRLTYMF